MQFISRNVRRLEKWKSLDMIPVGVGDENGDPAGIPVELGFELFAELADAGPGVEDDDLFAAPDFEACGVAAVALDVIAVARGGPPNPLERDAEPS